MLLSHCTGRKKRKRKPDRSRRRPATLALQRSFCPIFNDRLSLQSSPSVRFVAKFCVAQIKLFVSSKMSSGEEEVKTAPAEEKKGGRGRPAKKEAAPKEEKKEAAKRPAEAAAEASAPKKGRGRPKGGESKAKKAAKPKVRLSPL